MPPKGKYLLGEDGLQSFIGGRRALPSHVLAYIQKSVYSPRFRGILDPKTGFYHLECTHCMVRNSLSKERAEKLIFIKANMAE
jgi:hypothetical protein